MDYVEPKPLPFAALIEAQGEYRVKLKDHPHAVWSLYGLKSVLAAEGKQDPKLMRILPSARPTWTSGLQRHEYKPVGRVTETVYR